MADPKFALHDSLIRRANRMFTDPIPNPYNVFGRGAREIGNVIGRQGTPGQPGAYMRAPVRRGVAVQQREPIDASTALGAAALAFGRQVAPPRPSMFGSIGNALMGAGRQFMQPYMEMGRAAMNQMKLPEPTAIARIFASIAVRSPSER